MRMHCGSNSLSGGPMEPWLRRTSAFFLINRLGNWVVVDFLLSGSSSRSGSSPSCKQIELQS
jgi:hypothetical protein